MSFDIDIRTFKAFLDVFITAFNGSLNEVPKIALFNKERSIKALFEMRKVLRQYPEFDDNSNDAGVLKLEAEATASMKNLVDGVGILKANFIALNFNFIKYYEAEKKSIKADKDFHVKQMISNIETLLEEFQK